MRFLRWRRRNTYLHDYIWMIAAAIAFVVALGFLSNGPEFAGAISIIVFFVLWAGLTLLISFGFPNALIGSLRLNYKKMEFEARTIFEERGIIFTRTPEKKRFRYELPEYGLTMTIEPLQDAGLTTQSDSTTASKVIFKGMTGRNRSFVSDMSDALDGAVKRLTAEPPAE